jgi:hypothetical protein|tara:strand:+ start:2756 stop:4291 length:1536 start_codon:yes stop_codon:yes gene_type:complete
MSDDGSPGSSLRTLTGKLRHSLLDIRERALASLGFKLDNGLLDASDVGKNLPILRALLEWFNFEDTGTNSLDVIELLRRVATNDPSSVQRLLELGADRFLKDLASDGDQHLTPSIESLIAFWEKGNVSDDGKKSAPASPARTSSSKQASYAAAATKARLAGGASFGDTAEELTTDSEKKKTETATSGTADASPSQDSSSQDSPPGFRKDSNVDSKQEQQAPPPVLDPKTKELFLRNPRLAATYWRLTRQHDDLGTNSTERDRAAAMRAHLVEEASLVDGGDCTKNTRRGVLKLHRILLAPSDEQRVFELGVRLTYADQPALLLAALTELREAVLVDLPPQALIQRPTAIDAVVSLARAVDGPTSLARVVRGTHGLDSHRSYEDSDSLVTPGAVRAAALCTLLAFVESLKGALGHAADGAHRVAPTPKQREFDKQEKNSSNNVFPSLALASRAALSYPPPEGGLSSFAKFAPSRNAVPPAASHALGDALSVLPVRAFPTQHIPPTLIARTQD